MVGELLSRNPVRGKNVPTFRWSTGARTPFGALVPRAEGFEGKLAVVQLRQTPMLAFRKKNAN